MRLVFGAHARERMAERSITESQIREILTNPATTHPGPQGRTVYTGCVGGRSLKVVAKVRHPMYVIITTVWRTPDGR